MNLMNLESLDLVRDRARADHAETVRDLKALVAETDVRLEARLKAIDWLENLIVEIGRKTESAALATEKSPAPSSGDGKRNRFSPKIPSTRRVAKAIRTFNAPFTRIDVRERLLEMEIDLDEHQINNEVIERTLRLMVGRCELGLKRPAQGRGAGSQPAEYAPV